MDWRKKELLDLKSFTQNVETEVTMLLQSLQWDRKRLLEGTSTVTCQYDANHKMPEDNLETHESKCILRSLGYAETDELLPDPPDNGAHTLVKLNNNEIQQIIYEASKADPRFKKGVSHQPLSLSRLQLMYTADERRALHDAVVAAVPSCHDLGDLALASSNEGTRLGKTKSRVEILAELRDMKRRRTKYRVAAKTKNYSDVLRDVIKTQMESYTEAVSNTLTVKTEENVKHNQNKYVAYDIHKSRNDTSGKYDNVMSRDKSEERRILVVRESSDTTKSTYDVHHKESRHREKRKRKETSNKRHKDRHSRSHTRERHYESFRDKKIREEDKHRERSREKYRSRREHSSTRHDNSGKDRNRCDEENGHKFVGRDNLKKIDRRKDYGYADRRSESRHYKEKYIKIKVEADDQNISRKSSLSKQLHKSESKRHRRSRSGDRRREDRKRKHTEEYESSSHRDVSYKRYYDVEVKKEEA